MAEARLLCRCATTEPSPAAVEEIHRLVAADVDWIEFVGRADRHKLLSLAYWTLSRAAPDALPPTLSHRLKLHLGRNTQRNLQLLAELKRILAECAAEKLGVVPFKGLALASSLYGNMALREAGDLDLLVRRGEMPAVIALLRRMGYESDSPMNAAKEHSVLNSKYCYHLGFTHASSGIVVEPHWGIMPRFYSPRLDHWTRGVWDRLQTQDIFGVAAPTVAVDDLPILLTVHAGRHLWGQLNWVCDLAELIRNRPDLDWQRTMKSADAIGQGRVLRVGLHLAANLVGAEIPASIADPVHRDRGAARLAHRAGKWLLSGADAGDFSRTRFIIRSMELPADRVSWIWHHLLGILR
jgi:hypothetical protein